MPIPSNPNNPHTARLSEPFKHYEPTNSCLKNHTILITGASDGIGRCAALTYAKFGATVILLGKTVAKLESVYDAIIDQGGPQPGIAVIDLAVASATEMQQLADTILANYGTLDGLLHNAAILGERTPFEHYNMNTWMKVLQVNFTNVCLLTRILLPLLQSATNASVIFTSSSVGAVPRAYWGAYSVSKYALEGFAKLLMDELENTSNVRINILNPGATGTKLRKAAYPNEDPASIKQPTDLMPLYLYLMDSKHCQTKGQTINSDWLQDPTASP
ncbi:MAG: YciK family oxidoreductase [Pseudomonadales bacterium]|nr:YciK family oxidoreductase [Pseudomonadales bacterium]